MCIHLLLCCMSVHLLSIHVAMLLNVLQKVFLCVHNILNSMCNEVFALLCVHILILHVHVHVHVLSVYSLRSY